MTKTTVTGLVMTAFCVYNIIKVIICTKGLFREKAEI